MIEIKIKKTGDKELILKLENFSKDISLLSDPLEESARYMRQQAIMNFAVGGSLMQGRDWKDLAEVTKKKKMREVGFVYPILVRTRRLINSFEITSPRITKDYGEISVFNSVEYAIYHQEGTSKMPQRVILRFQKQQIEDIYNIINNWLFRIIDKNFR